MREDEPAAQKGWSAEREVTGGKGPGETWAGGVGGLRLHWVLQAELGCGLPVKSNRNLRGILRWSYSRFGL